MIKIEQIDFLINELINEQEKYKSLNIPEDYEENVNYYYYAL